MTVESNESENEDYDDDTHDMMTDDNDHEILKI